eukprot:1160780-Pelagomonas_calceolata.AAC.13
MWCEGQGDRCACMGAHDVVQQQSKQRLEAGRRARAHAHDIIGHYPKTRKTKKNRKAIITHTTGV